LDNVLGEGAITHVREDVCRMSEAEAKAVKRGFAGLSGACLGIDLRTVRDLKDAAKANPFVADIFAGKFAALCELAYGIEALESEWTSIIGDIKRAMWPITPIDEHQNPAVTSSRVQGIVSILNQLD
jgi:hypothetical protein